MRTEVNPGSRLDLTGSFEVASLAYVEGGFGCGDAAAPVAARGTVVDRESGHEVNLADLLRSFLQDPTETITGPIRITIQPEQPPSILEQAWRVAMSGPHYAVAELVGSDDPDGPVPTVDPDTVRSTAEEAIAAWTHERVEVEGYDEAELPPFMVIRLN